VGLYFGDWVVRRIQDPLVAALTEYYTEQAVDRFMQRIAEAEAKGQEFPAELKNRDSVRAHVIQSQLLPEEVYVNPGELLKQLQKQHPESFKGLELPDEEPSGQQFSRDSMARILIWHAVEDDDRIKVKGMNAQEAFMIWIKAAFFFGAVVASPFVFYFLWSFVAAGLYPHEKKYVNYFLPFSLALFLCGAGLAFFFVFQPVLRFFFSFNQSLGIDPDPRISEWMSFVLLMPLGFGVSFQLPLVMLFLARIGIFDVEVYLAKWRIAVLVIAVLSMVLSPGGDPYSMMMMLVPLVLLYFGGIALCRWLPPVNRTRD
jgi:sec-independent protein translocase protein TatC